MSKRSFGTSDQALSPFFSISKKDSGEVASPGKRHDMPMTATSSLEDWGVPRMVNTAGPGQQGTDLHSTVETSGWTRD
jgi:hypothetical protein